METIAAACPICHATRQYGTELVGRYTLCLNCRSRFYVEVPTLEKSQASHSVERPKPSPKTEATLDDLLWDTQQGSRYIIESLRRQEASARWSRLLIALSFLLGLANLAGIVLLWMKLVPQ